MSQTKIKTLHDPALALTRGLAMRKRSRRKRQPVPKTISGSAAVKLRPYQQVVFDDNQTGIIILHWSRQIGKSYTLAAWAVDRLLRSPGRLVTVLSNSRENGAEFLRKCAEICRLHKTRCKTVDRSGNSDFFHDMRMELTISGKGKTGRIKVLAANPRTARGFSGDLILDEFAFHEDSAAIWEAAEPILSSNPDFLCRIASTGNGKHNLFYRIAHAQLSANHETQEMKDGICVSAAGFKLSRVPRTLAHQIGVPIYDPQSREKISRDTARAQALDKHAYDQNYECAFADESATLLTHELISAAEGDGVGEICGQEWSVSALELLAKAAGDLYVGFDVARRGDLSVITVVEFFGGVHFVRGILRMRDLRLPEQQLRLGQVCRIRKFHPAAIDMTGLGLGLFEYAEKEFGGSRIHGVNFASSVPATDAVRAEGRKRETVRVTEALALELLQAFEDRRIKLPADGELRDDLRKPEKVTTPGGRVSIAATRDAAGHADHFWSLALALEAASVGGGKFAWEPIRLLGRRGC